MHRSATTDVHVVEVVSATHVRSGDRAPYPDAGWRGRKLAMLDRRVVMALFLVAFQALLPQGKLLAASIPVRIQTKGAIGNYTNALAVTFNSPTTSGNQLVVSVVDYYANDGVPFSISDSGGNVWKSAVDYANGAHIIVFYAENIVASANEIVTVAASSSTYF